MSKLKKLGSLLLALVFALGLTCTAFAADITITNANAGETYNAYLIFTATTSDSGGVTYYIDSNTSAYWDYIVAMSNLASDEQKEASDYAELFTLVETGTDGLYQVTWVGDGDSSNDGEEGHEDEVDSAIIAYLVSVGAKGSVAGTVTPDEDGSAKITVSKAGYYFVTTTTGSVVSINTSADSVNITDKNAEPTVDKKASETASNYSDSDTYAQIGDTVYFQSTISNVADAANLKLIDTLSEGLTLNENSIVVTLDDTTLDDTTLVKDIDYTIVTSSTGFTITFLSTSETLAAATSTSTIVVTYNATVNGDADIYTDANTNTTYVTYGNSSESEKDSTKTYVYDIDLSKKDGSGNTLTAKFTLTRSGESSPVYFVAVKGGYRVATADEIASEEVTTTTTIEAGSVNISGLDAGTYTLTETEAPEGYNQLTSSVTITINTDGTVTVSGNDLVSSTSSTNDVTVINNAGSSLPSTGGIGTTIFYVVGGV
ncbi:MAG: hypothetical protein LUG45_04940, partial [Clostridiales bacterium]|nr:hypothetical protein [Clostridiales bacterium]